MGSATDYGAIGNDAGLNEPPLRSFVCSQRYHSRQLPYSADGELTISFTPRSPEDAVFRLQFHSGQTPSPCHLDLEGGVFGGRLRSLDTPARCLRSSHSAYAVSCGQLLGSDLQVLLHAASWMRTVKFRLSMAIPVDKLPAQSVCNFPFVEYNGDAAPAR